jgi:DNA repair exonuclease SbcCD nuclease subunit
MIGDPHATVDELRDCQALEDYAFKVGVESGADTVLYQGDLHHNHAMINVHIIAFWKRVFARWLAAGKRVIALVGNHDMPGDGSSESHSLLAYPEVVVVDKPTPLGRVLFMPYMADKSAFIRIVNDHKPAILFCHQDFDGAQYDNGFYSPDGVDPGAIEVGRVVSGHIHTPQSFDKVWYPGAPRWRTLSDAGAARYIYTLDLDVNEGTITAAEGHFTGDVCKVIHSITVRPGQPLPVIDWNSKDEYRVHIEGPPDFVQIQKTTLAEAVPNVKVSTLVTDDLSIKVRESDGVDVAFRKYVATYQPQYGTPADALLQKAIEVLSRHVNV